MAESQGAAGFNGMERTILTFTGGRGVRVSHAPGARIEGHAHEWPNLTIHEMGSGIEGFDGGQWTMVGPAVILHPAGSYHSDSIGKEGLETTGIMFDPKWLAHAGLEAPLDRPSAWLGGPVAAAARQLARLWNSQDASEAAVATSTARFLNRAAAEPPPKRPDWIDDVLAALGQESPPSTNVLAKRLGLSPAWLARAFRAVIGEGIQEYVLRKRVERATALLRFANDDLCNVALSAGFCDQAHMNRAFRTILGFTPKAVRTNARRPTPS